MLQLLAWCGWPPALAWLGIAVLDVQSVVDYLHRRRDQLRKLQGPMPFQEASFDSQPASPSLQRHAQGRTLCLDPGLHVTLTGGHVL